jgi:hypothetical protein
LRQGRESKSNFRTPRCRLPAEEVNFRRVQRATTQVQRGLGGGVFVFVTLCFSAVRHCQPPFFSCWQDFKNRYSSSFQNRQNWSGLLMFSSGLPK